METLAYARERGRHEAKQVKEERRDLITSAVRGRAL